MMRTLAALLLLASACDPPDRTAPLVLSDAQTIGILSALAAAEQLEAQPAQVGAYSPSVVLVASVFIDDQSGTMLHLQRSGIAPASTPESEYFMMDGRAEQIAMSLLVGRQLDDHFLVREAAAHAARIKFVREQVSTRCQSTAACDLAHAYILQEQQHVQRLSHP